MDKIAEFFGSIDWIFAAVILIGGRYWGSKYFKASKNPALNFLVFATMFGGIWLFISYITGGLSLQHAGNLFLTYLFTTSFYELLAKKIFEVIENFFGGKKNEPQPTNTQGPGGDRPPDPPIKP